MISEWRASVEASMAGRGAIGDLEATFCDWLGVRFAVAVSSGTLALYLALRAAGIRVGDEVIVPAFDWFAPTAAVLHCWAVPCFADVDASTYTISPRAVACCLSEHTRAVIATHLFGNPCDLTALREWCDRNRIVLIEDASQAMGATCAGKLVGSWGDLACFSLGARKLLSTGEGGIVVTSHQELYDRLLALCAHPVRQVYAGVSNPNPFSLRSPLNPLGVEYFLQTWETFHQHLQQQQAKLSQLNQTIHTLRLPLQPVQVASGCTHTAYQICPRLLHEQEYPSVQDALQSRGWNVCMGSLASYIPDTLRASLDARHWDEHPFVDRVKHRAASECPNAQRIEQTVITVDR